ncbi:hypothetical protein AIOGIFDO_02077 [Candidatus Methanoperedenaceae archaeon GB37]|nr:hypothetical protein AIOGIFDO_02077 [Candidatus Methanoperedenaceae archaeon GB37]
MVIENARGRNFRTTIGITTLAILLLLACAGTAARTIEAAVDALARCQPLSAFS